MSVITAVTGRVISDSKGLVITHLQKEKAQANRTGMPHFLGYFVAGLLLLLALLPATSAVAASYGLLTLEAPGMTKSAALDINDSGLAVGWAIDPAGITHAVLWTADTHEMVDLGTLGGTSSSAAAINSRGQVVGSSTTANGEEHAFLWSKGRGMQDLGTLGGASSTAADINDAGQIIGTSYIAGDSITPHAFLWTQGARDGIPTNPEMKDLNTVGDYSFYARGINNQGQIVGTAQTDQHVPYAHAYLWSPRTGQKTDLTPGMAAWSFANAINEAGEISGSVQAAPGHDMVAVRWTATGELQDLGASGNGSAINRSGHIAGGPFYPTPGAFLWDPGANGGGSPGSQLIDLSTPTPEQVSSHAAGINDRGWVAGSWVDVNGEQYACVWVPKPLLAAKR